jgi:GTP-binding protein YchF
MGFNCGIVGLPNVGKSTLFNALTETAAAEAANYPFCTIEPNTGRVAVPDPRLDELAKLASSASIIPTQLEFVDIAGLVRGASKGEGLGNQFLANIREVDAIAHVLRCFEDTDITHVDGSVDPLRDADTVDTELMLADMDSLERRMAALVKKTRGGDAEAKRDLALMEKLLPQLADGVPVRRADGLTPDENKRLPQLQLLTSKPVLYVCNVAEADAATGNVHSEAVAAHAAAEGAAHVVVSAAIEAEITQLDGDDKAMFLGELGLEEAGLARLIRAGYGLLDLLTFFTVGPKEARAWTVAVGATAPEAAGVIHTDFQRGFIRAETVSFDDYVTCGGESGARDAGKLRIEGADYKVKDGDVFHFRFNV